MSLILPKFTPFFACYLSLLDTFLSITGEQEMWSILEEDLRSFQGPWDVERKLYSHILLLFFFFFLRCFCFPILSSFAWLEDTLVGGQKKSF